MLIEDKNFKFKKIIIEKIAEAHQLSETVFIYYFLNNAVHESFFTI